MKVVVTEKEVNNVSIKGCITLVMHEVGGKLVYR